jgi:hypothetical protein
MEVVKFVGYSIFEAESEDFIIDHLHDPKPSKGMVSLGNKNLFHIILLNLNE